MYLTLFEIKWIYYFDLPYREHKTIKYTNDLMEVSNPLFYVRHQKDFRYYNKRTNPFLSEYIYW